MKGLFSHVRMASSPHNTNGLIERNPFAGCALMHVVTAVKNANESRNRRWKRAFLPPFGMSSILSSLGVYVFVCLLGIGGL